MGPTLPATYPARFKEDDPSRRRPDLLRLLALLSPVSAGAVVVVSDLASANTPKAPRPEPIAMLEPAQNAAPVKAEAKSKKPRRKPRMDFGRFEGS